MLRRADTPKKYEHIDFTPPKSVANAAEKGLEYREKASPSNKGGLTVSEASKQGIGSGVQRAVNLKNRNTLSPDTIKQMHGFFSRHEKNKGVAPEHKSEPWNDKGNVAWLLWGGDPGQAWAAKVLGQMEAADEKEKAVKKAAMGFARDRTASTPPTLYHLTTLAALRKIMRSNRLHTGAFRAVSFTEDPSLFGQDFQYGNDFGNSTVRIVVDGAKLSRDYSVEPHVDGQSDRFRREKEWRVPGQSVDELSRYVKCVEVLSRRPHDETDHYWKRVGLGWDPKRKVDLRQKVLDEVVSLGESTGFRVVVSPKPGGRGCVSSDLARGRTASVNGDGSSVGFFIPLSAELASQYEVKPEDTSPPHVTFLYVGNVAPEQVSTFLRVARGVLQDAPPVFGVLNGVDSFVQKDKNQRVLYSRVSFSHDLKPLRDRLWAALTEAGFKVEQAFPAFTPHVTIEYRDGLNDAVLDQAAPLGSWDCKTIEVWGLPKKYTLPLGGRGGKQARTASGMSLSLDDLGYGSLTTDEEALLLAPSTAFPAEVLALIPQVPCPENSSEETRRELAYLLRLQQTARPYLAQQVVGTDENATSTLEAYCAKHGLDASGVLPVVRAARSVLLQVKRLYNRPRPYQLAEYLEPGFHPMPSTTAHTPSYPSGHSAQAVLVALLLSGLYPEHREAFMALAKEVGQHRMVGGYHFPSDVAYGEQIGRVLYESMARASVRTAAAKYKDKKQVPKADGSGKTTVYVYSERQVANRHREKAERLEDFKPALAELRAQVKKDLDSDDPKKNLVALAVGLIDATYERVGNDESADNGHYGVTGWLRKHVTFKGKRAVIRYTGKSGVKHEKSVDDEALVGALKKCCGDKDGEEQVLSLGKHAVTSGDVNKYLKPYGITAKDLRGLHANREMQERLRAIRSKGPKLPRLRKERDPILKEEFKQALEGAAEAVGHEPSTLRKQYLVPGIEDAYMKDGTVPRDLTASTRRVAAHYRRVSTRSLRLDPTVRAFFKQFASVFEAYPNLWVKGGGARDALMNFYADHAAGYQRATRSMRDIDLVLIGGTIAEKVALLSQFEGTVKPEDLDIRAASLGQYFKTRDVGINEVALRPDFMLFTDKAVNDIHRGVVNPSGGSFDPEWQNLSPRVGLRSVLFALREGLNPFDNQLVGEAVLSARPFDLLLHLYKAFDTGVPDEFYAAVQANPYLRGTHSAEEALLSLSEKVYDFTRTPAQQRTYDDARSLVLGDRWEGQGWRVAAKSDAEREDEEAERLVKPEPKYKPPRGDLRRRRVDTERDDDPDKKQDDKDRSQNYKDASVRAVVQRVAAAWLFKVGQGNPLMERAKKEFEAYEKKHPDTELDVNTFLERLAQRSKTTSEGSNTDAETKADAAHYAQQERKVKTERVQKLVDKVSAEWAELENSLPLTSENRKRISSSIDSYTPKQREEFAKAFASAREAHVRKYSDEGYDPDAVSTALLDMDAKFTKADPKRVAEHAVEVIFTDRVLLNPMLLTPDDPLSDDEGKGTADPKKSAARVSQSIQRFSRASKRERAEMSKRLDAAIREAPEGTAKQEELLAVRFGLTAAEALHPIKEDGDDEGKADQDPKPPKGMSKVEFGLLQHLADDSEKSSELLGLSFRASRKDKSAQEDTRKFVREATRSMKPEQINNLLPEEMQSASLAVRSLLKEMASDRASFRKSKGKSTAKEDAAISEYEAEMDALGDMLGERLSDLVADSVGRKVQPEDDDVGSVYKNMVKNRPKLNGGKPPSKKDFGAFLDDLMKSFRKLLGNKGVTAHLHLAEPPRVSVGGLYHL